MIALTLIEYDENTDNGREDFKDDFGVVTDK